MKQPTLRILGIRGVPAAHGGFETFAEHLAPYLVKKGWRVIVYCQEEGRADMRQDLWQGVERVFFSVPGHGPASTIHFDWLSTLHAAKHQDLCLTLGYNTAIFCAMLRLRGIQNVINMDGIEWSRAKWNALAKAWFWINERAGCWLGNHLVADHPEIKTHLATRVRQDKITTIAYGADEIGNVSDQAVRALGLVAGRYLTVIARPEPENSLLEIVRGFSARRRGVALAVLGQYSESNDYHVSVKAAASDEVVFLGAIYDKVVVQALRAHSLAYVHGHQVGGTNPSLVEALGAGNAVIAHDNRFNRWVAGGSARYFATEQNFSAILDELLQSRENLDQMRLAGKARFDAEFTWPLILKSYEALLLRHLS